MDTPHRAAAPLAEPLRATLAAHVERTSIRAVATAAAVPRVTLARAIAGAPVRRGTAMALAAALDELEIALAEEAQP